MSRAYTALLVSCYVFVCLVHWLEKEHEPKTSDVNFGT